MQTPIRFKDEQDRLTSEHEKNMTLAWLAEHTSEIINLQDRLKHLFLTGLRPNDLHLLDLVLNSVVCGIFHDMAEKEFLLGRIGFDDKEQGESHLPS